MVDTKPSNFHEIYKFIFNGERKAGDKAPTEDEIMKAFGLTRYRVRLVLSELVQMGLLERKARAGTVVCKPDTTDLSNRLNFQFEITNFDEGEFTEARMILEPAVIPTVISRITPAQKAKMREMIEEIKQKASKPIEADKIACELHVMLFVITGNRVLSFFPNALRAYFKNTTKLLEGLPKSYFLEVAELFGVLLERIEEKDVAGAISAIEEIIVGHPRKEMLKQLKNKKASFPKSQS